MRAPQNPIAPPPGLQPEPEPVPEPEPLPAPTPRAMGPALGACRLCAYWIGPLEVEPGDSGECRIRPPLLGPPFEPEMDDLYRLRAVWPWTEADEWCGEFLKR